MSLVGIAVLIIFVLFALNGMRKGLVKKLSGVAAVIISAVLVNFLLPYVTQILKDQTPLYDLIRQQCEKVISDEMVGTALKSTSASGSSGGLDRDQIKSLLNQYGLDSSQVDYLSDSELQSYVDQYLQDYRTQVTEAAGPALGSLSKVDQTKLIKNLPVPSFLQKMMINYNNSEGYRTLGVSDFAGYLVNFFASIILNILAFILTMLVTWIIVRAILSGLDLFSHAPVLRSVNRIGGLLVGAVQGLFVVWILFLAVSLFSGTGPGLALQNMIDDSLILQPMYETNAFLKIVTNAIGNIM